MFRCILTPENFQQVLMEISTSTEKVFDFSRTDFTLLNTQSLSKLFSALDYLPHPFTLMLNNCKMNEENLTHMDALTLGIMTTPKLEGFEFVRSISSKCSVERSEEMLTRLAQSLIRNPNIKSIIIDGFRVTPPSVCEILKNYSAAESIFIDWLPKSSRLGLFKPASNEPISPEPNQNVSALKHRSGK